MRYRAYMRTTVGILLVSGLLIFYLLYKESTLPQSYDAEASRARNRLMRQLVLTYAVSGLLTAAASIAARMVADPRQPAQRWKAVGLTVVGLAIALWGNLALFWR